MEQMIIGIALLLGILFIRRALSFFQMKRMKQNWELANEALQSNDLNSAEKSFNKCVKMVPQFVAARIMLGLVMAKQGKLESAEEQIKMGADLEPRKPDGHTALAAFYANFRPERIDDAFASLNKAVEYNPELRAQLAQDPRFAALRSDVRFHDLLEVPIAN